MEFEDFTLDQLADCLFEVLYNSDASGEQVAHRILKTLENHKQELQEKLDRTNKILDLLNSEAVCYDEPKESNAFTDPNYGFEWTPLMNPEPNRFDIFTKTPEDKNRHSKYYNDK